MADLALGQRPSKKWDFVLQNGDLVRTDAPTPSVLRLLLQGTWIGDNGERNGDSLSDVRLITTQIRDQVRRIVETRLSPLLRRGELTSFELVDVQTLEGVLVASIRLQRPGQQPESIQVRVTR